MTKTELIEFISNQNDCSKAEAEKAVNLFTSAVISAINKGNEVSLLGFGNFTISAVAARTGMNPKTKEPLQIEAYNQVRFKVGQKLKDAVNNNAKDKPNNAKVKADKKNTDKGKIVKAKK